MWWPNERNIARKIKAYIIRFGPKTALSFRISTPLLFLAGISQGSQKREEALGLLLHLPYKSCTPAVALLVSRPQRCGPAIEFHLAHHLLAAMFPELGIHQLVQFRSCSFG
jgi:hypothetical protein